MLSSLCTAVFSGIAAYFTWRCFGLLASNARNGDPISVSLEGTPYARVCVRNTGDRDTGPFKLSLYVPEDQATFGLSGAFADLPTMRSGADSIEIDDLSFSEAVYESAVGISARSSQAVAQVALFAHDSVPAMVYWRFRSDAYSASGTAQAQ